MSKLKNATKKITAIAASAVMVSSAAFGAGLSNYPMNFVDNNKFNGQVVVGAAAAAMDTTSAQSIIDDLRAELSGDVDRVEITYRSAATGGEAVPIRSAGSKHTYGKDLSDVKGTAFFDTDLNILRDTTLRVGSTNKDVEQEITMAANGEFEHALRHRLSNEISSHIFIERGLVFTYEAIVEAIDTDDFERALGNTMTLLGNSYTIVELDEDMIKLVGGASKISLGEGETSTVTVDGSSYTVQMLSVGADRVLVSVNGETRTVREFENLQVGGVNVAVTDLIQSARESVKGYAEIVVGGDELVLEDGTVVEMNGESIDDIYDDYRVEVSFSNGGTGDFTGFTLEYFWDGTDGIILTAGDSYEDKVFNAFRVEFEGINNVNYEEIRLDSSGEWIAFSAESVRGDSISENMVYVFEQDNGDFHSFLAGRDDLTMTLLDDFDAADTWAINLGAGEWAVITGDQIEGAALDTGEIDSFLFAGAAADVTRLFELEDTTVDGGEVTSVNHMKADGAAGVRFLVGDDDTQYLYEVNRYRTADDEYTFEDILRGTTRTGISTQVEDRLNDVSFAATTDGNITEIGNTRSNNGLALANQMMVDFSGASIIDLSTTNRGVISFEYDTSDITEDTSGDAGTFNLEFYYDGTDNEVVFVAPDFLTGFPNVPTGARADVTSSSSDIRERVDGYGTKVRWDNRDGMYVTIHVPDRQVEAHVNLVSGTGAAATSTVTVDKANVEAKRAELIDAGYTIVGTKDLPSMDVEFDITAPVMDSAVTGWENMIVVGGPAVNRVAAQLLGLDYPTYGSASGVSEGEAVIRYFEASNSVLVYGYEQADTRAAAMRLNQGGLSGSMVEVQ